MKNTSSYNSVIKFKEISKICRQTLNDYHKNKLILICNSKNKKNLFIHEQKMWQSKSTLMKKYHCKTRGKLLCSAYHGDLLHGKIMYHSKFSTIVTW